MEGVGVIGGATEGDKVVGEDRAVLVWVRRFIIVFVEGITSEEGGKVHGERADGVVFKKEGVSGSHVVIC